MQTAVAAASSEKFALQIFDDTYVFSSKWLISFIRWTEWDAGSSLSRFGSLRFSFHESRQQHTKYTVGIVYIPDDTLPTDNVWDVLASWIKAQDIPLVTGNFGLRNASGITKTAVAAGESVNHRICPYFDYKTHATDTPFAWMSGGFLIFAEHNKLVDQVSEFTLVHAGRVGSDIISMLEMSRPTWLAGKGNANVHNLWGIKHKKVAWGHHIDGQLQCRVYLG